MYEIEKDVAMPDEKQKHSQYGFSRMEVGDSIFIPTEGPRPELYSSASYYAMRHPGLKFTTRRVKGGYRIWRIK